MYLTILVERHYDIISNQHFCSSSPNCIAVQNFWANTRGKKIYCRLKNVSRKEVSHIA